MKRTARLFLGGLLSGLVAIATYTAITRAQAPEQPPAGTTMVVVLTSDGMTWLPVAAVPVPPTACNPGGAP